MNEIRDWNCFLCFSAYLIPFWQKIMPERGFLIFLLLFSEFSSPGRVWTEFGTKFFFSFSAYLTPFWLKVSLERGFLIFWFFFSIFFRNFLARVEYERNSGLNFFFLGLSHLVLAKNNAGKRFYNFLNFFTNFFEIFMPGPSMNGIRD